jgi:oxalate decarboxylase
MKVPKEIKPGTEGLSRSDYMEEKSLFDHPSRRSFLGLSSAAIASAAFVGLNANAQDKASTQKAEHDHSSSDPAQENRGLLTLNPNSNTPPPTTATWCPSGTPSIW